MEDLIRVGKSKPGKNKSQFWSCERILEQDADYYVVLSGRSDGKTYSFLKYTLEQFWKTKKAVAIVRRYQEDFRGKSGPQMYVNLISNGEIEKITGGKWTHVYYYSSRWYLAKYIEVKGEKKMIKDTEPFAYGFALSSQEHYKSAGYPDVGYILFDEIIAHTYLKDEFVLFMNLLSTIVRFRGDIKIFMIGNLINPYCPYTEEMGLYNVKNMDPDDIDLYKYGEDGQVPVKVAVELSQGTKGRTGEGKESDKYFAFNNPSLKMITDASWQIPMFPHLPMRYKTTDILYTYFIIFSGEIFQCEIINTEGCAFTYIHRKTTELKEKSYDLIFCQEHDPRPNYRYGMKYPQSNLEKKIMNFFKFDSVYYQDNTVGNAIANFLEWSRA